MRYVALACLMLAGCGLSPEYRAERDAKQLAAFSQKCVQMGFKEATPEHSNCQLELQKAAIAGEAQVRAGAAARPAPQMRQPMRCTTIGNQTTCF